MSDKFEKMKAEISKFFPVCPLCQEKSIEIKLSADYFGRDYVVCSSCFAKWHIYYLGELKWAKLTKTGTGRGSEYVGIEADPAFWLDMIEGKEQEHLEQELGRTKDKSPLKKIQTTIKEIKKEITGESARERKIEALAKHLRQMGLDATVESKKRIGHIMGSVRVAGRNIDLVELVVVD